MLLVLQSVNFDLGSTSRLLMAGARGIEPRFTESKSVVLPLNYAPIVRLLEYGFKIHEIQTLGR